VATPAPRPVEIAGVRCRVRDIRPEDATALLDLRVRNREFLRAFEPVPSPDHFELAKQATAIDLGNRGWDDDAACAPRPSAWWSGSRSTAWPCTASRPP